MITLKVLKQDKRTGNRVKGTLFNAPEHEAQVWINLRLVRDVSGELKPIKAKK